MSDGPQLKVEDLLRDGNFNNQSSSSLFNSFVAEIIEENSSTKLIGYSIGFFTYSTWQGKAFFLEDIYVKPEFRNRGVGKKIFIENVKFANDQKCKRFDFHVLDWNPAKKFYEKLGAKNLTKAEGWEFYRLGHDEIVRLSGE